MPDYSSRNISKNSRLLFAYKCMSMALSFVYVPVVLSFLGDGLYGIWATLLSVLSWIGYFDIGIGNGLRNRLSASLARGDDPRVGKGLISSAYFLLAAIVAVILVVSLLVFQVINWESALNIDSALYSRTRLVVSVSFALMCLSFVFSICKSLFFAFQQAHIVNLIGVVQQALMLISVLALSHVGCKDNLLGVAIAYGVSAIAVELLFTILFFSKNNQLAPSASYVTKESALDVTNLGIQFFVIQVASLVLFSTDNIIVSNVFGPEAVTPYATVNKLFMVPLGIYASVISPYWSSITASFAVGEIDLIRRALSRMKSLLILPIACCVLLCVLFDPITYFWLGRGLDCPVGLVWLTLVYCVVYCWNSIYSQVSNGLGCMKMMIWVAVIQAIINIPLSFAFALVIGTSTGVLLGTICSMLVSSIVYPLYIRDVLEGSEKEVRLG